MEAAPRLQMLCFELKHSPKAAEFGQPLKRYIAGFYHEDPANYSKAISDLEQLRIAATKPPKDFGGCAVLKRYYSQLRMLQNRFPMTDDGAACVAFMWSDLYSGVVFNIADVKYELSSILYNIGALHSQLGALEDRTTAEGMKNACTHFQCAAWAFQHNRDSYPQPKGCDLSHDLLTFYSFAMLAQSQECILEKSMLDNRKSSISAKIASQIVDFYTKSINHLTSDIKGIVGTKIYKQWKRICEMKGSYYAAVTALHQGISAEEANEYGNRVGWYQQAMLRFEESLAAAKDLGIDDSLAFTLDVIGGKLNAAVKENDFVYHEKVPAQENLPEVKGAVLVKGIPFDPADPEVSGPDLFSTLIPMGAHEASSVYSEQKAEVLRDISSIVDDKNSQLAAYESSLNVDRNTLAAMQVRPGLPADVIQMCAIFNTRRTAISDLNGQLSRLNKMSDDIGKMLEEAATLLTMSKVGSSSSNLVAELRAECTKYKEIHSHSVKSNSTLKDALKAHDESLALLQLTPDVLQQKLPHVIEITSEDKKVIHDLSRLFDKVDEMKAQRSKLFQDLRESMINDDITKQLVASSKSNPMEVFEKALTKHNAAIAVLDQNLLAQENILKAVTQANANFAEVRLNLEQARKPWYKAIEGLMTSCKAFEEVEMQTHKGLDFFDKFYANVNKVVTRLRSAVQVEKEQEERLKMRVQPTVPSPAAGTPAAPGQPAKLKDYLAMMEAKKNQQYMPPGAPSSAYTGANTATIASSAMGNATSISQNYPSPQVMSNYYMPSPGGGQPAPGMQSSHPGAVYGQGQTMSQPSAPSSQASGAATAPAPTPVPPAQQPMQSGEGAPSTSNNLSGAQQVTQVVQTPQTGGYVATNPPASALTSQQQSQLYGAYSMANLGYSYPSYPGYSPYASTAAYSYPTTTHTTSTATLQPPAASTAVAPASNTSIATTYSTPSQAYSTSYAYGQTNGYQYPYQNPYSATAQPAAAPYAPPTSQSAHNPATSQSTVPSSVQYSVPGNTSKPPAGVYTTPTAASGQPYPNTVGVTPQAQQATPAAPAPSTASATTPYGYPYPGQSTAAQSYFQQYYAAHGYDPKAQAGPVQNNTSSSQPNSTAPGVAVPPVNQPAPPAPPGVQAPTPAGHPGPSLSQGNQPSASQVPAGYNWTGYNFANTNPSMSQHTYVSSGAYTQPTITSTSVSGNIASGQQYAQYYQQYLQYMQQYAAGAQAGPTAVAQPGQAQGNAVTPAAPQPPPTAITTTVPSQLPPRAPVSSAPTVGGPTALAHPSTSLPPIQIPPTPAFTKTSNLLDESPVMPNPPSGQMILQPTVVSSEKKPEPAPVQEEVQPIKPPAEIQPPDLEVAAPPAPPPAPVVEPSPPKNPFGDPNVLDNFKNSLEKLEDMLRTTQIEGTWKAYLDVQETEARTLKISVARICPMKNRFPDIMPYDYNRVVLESGKDDYINASMVEPSCAGEGRYILTQAPIASSLEDFWTMVFEQQVEILVCLSSFKELSTQIFFPSEKGTSLNFGQYIVTVQSFSDKENGLFSERLLLLSNPSRQQRTLILLHLNEWNRDVTRLNTFCEQVMYYYSQQRNTKNPIVLQCLGGCGRSGVMACSLRFHYLINNGTFPNLMSVLTQLVRARKLVLLEKDQLKTCLDMLHFVARKRLIDGGHLPRPEEVVVSTVTETITVKERNGEELTSEERMIADLMEGFTVKTKITRESFDKPTGMEVVNDPSDPLSQLDPLWSLKK